MGSAYRWFASLWGKPGARRARPARVGLERLEDRCAHAVLAGAEAVGSFARVADFWNVEAGAAVGDLIPQPPSPDPDADPDPAPETPDAPEKAETPTKPSPCVSMRWDGPAGAEAVRPKTLARTADAEPSPAPAATVVTPLLASGDAGGFQLARTPVNASPVEVRYTLTAFNGEGAIGRERVATIPPGTARVHVPNDPPPIAGPEIVTLALRDGPGYRPALPSVSLFVGRDARDCSDRALVEAYRQGESAEAFSALVERNHGPVMRASYRVLRDWHDAEDVSQAVFLALGRRLEVLPASLAGWLRTVARNASIALLRARNRRARHERAAARPLIAAPDDPARELREELDAALRRVAGPLRDAVRLRYLDGWSQREAAQLAGCPRGTLSQRAALGVRCLRDLLAE